MADHFCHPQAPEDLKVIMRDITSLQKWVMPPRADAELSAALDWIYIHHVHHRKVIEDEIEERRHRKVERRLEELKMPHWSVPWTFWVALAAAIIALGAWLFPRAPDVPKEEPKSISAPVLAAPLSQPAHTAAPAPIAIQPSPKAAPTAISTPEPKP
jgi:hypothetical protein